MEDDLEVFEVESFFDVDLVAFLDEDLLEVESDGLSESVVESDELSDDESLLLAVLVDVEPFESFT